MARLVLKSQWRFAMKNMLGFLRSTPSSFEFDIRPKYPPVEELIERAERITESCVLLEQVNVSSRFLKDVAIRGVYSKSYSTEEAQRVSIIVDHLVKRKMRKLYAADAM
jgi:hypothetical protein